MKLSHIAKLIIESEDDKYVSIGYGRYKLKGKEKDDDADSNTSAVTVVVNAINPTGSDASGIGVEPSEVFHWTTRGTIMRQINSCKDG